MDNNEEDFLGDLLTASNKKDDDFLDGINATTEAPKKNDFSSKKSKFINVRGKNDINLWDKPVVQPAVLDTNKFKTETKYATVVLPNPTYQPTEQEMLKFKKLLTSLKAKEYKIRVICNFVKAIRETLIETMGMENITFITPWKSYCKEDTKTEMYMPSDDNIRASANYFKNFHKFNPSLQLIVTGIFSTCFGLENNEPSNMIIMCDPFYDGKKLDFTKSKDSSNYIFLSRTLELNVYNIYKDEDYVSAMKLVN